MKSSKLCNPAPFLLVALCVAIAGCGSSAVREDSDQLMKEGQYEAGIARLEEALREDPRDTELNIARPQPPPRRGTADPCRCRPHSPRLRWRPHGLWPGADPGAEQPPRPEGIRQLELIRTLDERVALGGRRCARATCSVPSATCAKCCARPAEPEGRGPAQRHRERPGAHRATLPAAAQQAGTAGDPEFRDANLKTIFEVLSQVAGINFIFDKDMRPDMKATIFVRDLRIEDAVALLLEQNQLRQKIVNENTLMIYPDSPQKTKDYQELVMRTFYLTSIDSNTALNMVKTMLKTRDVFVDERLNTLTMRDTPDAVRMAEKLLQSQDQSNPEVVLEVEVMEVATSRILDLGLQWPNTFGVLSSDGQPVSVLDQLKGIDSSRISIAPAPQAKINAQDKDINTPPAR